MPNGPRAPDELARTSGDGSIPAGVPGDDADVEGLRAQLADARAKLVAHEKLASLGMITSGIAHEIRNPLSFIRSFAELSVTLAEELQEVVRDLPAKEAAAARETAETLKDNLTRIHEHARRTDEILGSMLSHVRDRRGARVPSDLNGIVARNAELGRHPPRDMRAAVLPTLRLELDPSVPQMSVVPEDIGRVVLNLVGNAVHAALARHLSAPEGPPPEVRVHTRRLKDHIEIRVSDNGHGIPAAIQARVMEPFFTTKPPGQGTGLGLSIARDIVVNGHQGDIVIQTEEGERTEVIVSLPCAPMAG